MTMIDDDGLERPPSTAVGPRAGKPITKRRARRLAIKAGTHTPEGHTKRSHGTPDPTDEQIEAFTKYVRAGNFAETAGALAGVPRHVWRVWLERGADKAKARKWPMSARFSIEVEKAQEASIAASLATIEGAARSKRITKTKTTKNAEGAVDKVIEETTEDRGQWQATAWRLERMHPQRFALRVRHTVEAEIGAILDKLETALDPDTYARVLEIIASQEGGG